MVRKQKRSREGKMPVSGIGGGPVTAPWTVHAHTAIVQPKRVVGQKSFADDQNSDPANPSARASVNSIVKSAPIRESRESGAALGNAELDHSFEIIV